MPAAAPAKRIDFILDCSRVPDVWHDPRAGQYREMSGDRWRTWGHPDPGEHRRRAKTHASKREANGRERSIYYSAASPVSTRSSVSFDFVVQPPVGFSGLLRCARDNKLKSQTVYLAGLGGFSPLCCFCCFFLCCWSIVIYTRCCWYNWRKAGQTGKQTVARK